SLSIVATLRPCEALYLIIVTHSGALLPKPVKMSSGLLCVFSIVTPFLCVGTLSSKNFAAPFEEHDIVVPENDDDHD
uniref:Essential MCU regulator, mitochondrial n=1 Tax=Prolemur simus TaxID=1328070 RepID=A0A8C8ZXT1_PROSS